MAAIRPEVVDASFRICKRRVALTEEQDDAEQQNSDMEVHQLQTSDPLSRQAFLGTVPFSDIWEDVLECKIKIALERASREQLSVLDCNTCDLGLIWNDHGKPMLRVAPENGRFPLQIQVRRRRPLLPKILRTNMYWWAKSDQPCAEQDVARKAKCQDKLVDIGSSVEAQEMSGIAKTPSPHMQETAVATHPISAVAAHVESQAQKVLWTVDVASSRVQETIIDLSSDEEATDSYEHPVLEDGYEVEADFSHNGPTWDTRVQTAAAVDGVATDRVPTADDAAADLLAEPQPMAALPIDMDDDYDADGTDVADAANDTEDVSDAQLELQLASRADREVFEEAVRNTFDLFRRSHDESQRSSSLLDSHVSSSLQNVTQEVRRHLGKARQKFQLAQGDSVEVVHRGSEPEGHVSHAALCGSVNLALRGSGHERQKLQAAPGVSAGFTLCGSEPEGKKFQAALCGSANLAPRGSGLEKRELQAAPSGFADLTLCVADPERPELHFAPGVSAKLAPQRLEFQAEPCVAPRSSEPDAQELQFLPGGSAELAPCGSEPDAQVLQAAGDGSNNLASRGSEPERPMQKIKILPLIVKSFTELGIDIPKQPCSHESRSASETEACEPVLQRILVVGDVDGRFDLLHKMLDDYQERGTPIDLVLAVGKFLSSDDNTLAAPYCGEEPEKKLPAPVYFIEQSAELISHSKKRVSVRWQLAPDISFLGSCGVSMIGELKVAYLSGRYCPETVTTIWGTGNFVQECYTRNATQYVLDQAKQYATVDVLLTSEWPDVFWSVKERREAPSQVAQERSSPEVSQLFFALKPKRHFYAGAGKINKKKGPQGPHNFVSTSIAVTSSPGHVFSLPWKQSDSRSREPSSAVLPSQILNALLGRRSRGIAAVPQKHSAMKERIPQTSATTGDSAPKMVVTTRESAPRMCATIRSPAPHNVAANMESSPKTPAAIRTSAPQTAVAMRKSTPKTPDAIRNSVESAPETPAAIRNSVPSTAVTTTESAPMTPAAIRDSVPPVAVVARKERAISFSRTYGKPYYVEAETGRTTWLLPEEQGDADILTRISNHGVHLHGLGRFVEAAEVDKYCLGQRKRVLGATHADSLTSLINYASNLLKIRRVEDAADGNKSSLGLRENVVGERYTEMLTGISNCALDFRKLGRFEDAAEMDKHCLDFRRELLGGAHADTLTSLSSYALDLRKLGRVEMAAKMDKVCLDLRREVLGDRHVDTLTSFGNYALDLRMLGSIEEAFDMEKYCLDIRKEVLGEMHADTLCSLTNCEMDLRKLGRTL